tara:strand:- start:123 stop:248 length:126 start_codon:yes stop_codon:yes gene_type:complete
MTTIKKFTSKEDMAASFATQITEDQAKECRNKIESILGGTN